MIELGGTRYAVGPGTAWPFFGAAVLASLGAGFHAAYWSVFWVGISTEGLGALLLTLVVICAVFSFGALQLSSMMIDAAVSQKINDARGPDQPIRSPRRQAVIDTLRGLRSGRATDWPMGRLMLVVLSSGFTPILTLPVFWAGHHLRLPRAVVTIPAPALAIALSAAVAVLLWRLHSQLRRQARLKDSGGWIDLFHGWDWRRVETSEIRVFKDRHGDFWKPPTEVTETAKAINYAATARTRRSMVLLGATLTSLIGALGGLEALKGVIHHIGSLNGAKLSTLQAYGQIYGLGAGLIAGGLIFVALPWRLRTKADDLRDLTTTYDDRTKELRTAPSALWLPASFSSTESRIFTDDHFTPAELRAAEATATARTLREILDSTTKNAPPPAAAEQ